MEHFLCGPAVLWHAHLNADQLDGRHQRDGAIANRKAVPAMRQNKRLANYQRKLCGSTASSNHLYTVKSHARRPGHANLH